MYPSYQYNSPYQSGAAGGGAGYPAPSQQASGFPPQQGSYSSQQGPYSPQYAPQQQNYSSQQGSYPSQYAPQQQNYPSQGYPPPQGYPSSQGGYPPQGGPYTSQTGYPPHQQHQQGGPYPSPSQQGITQSNQGTWYASYYNQILPQEMQGLKDWFARVDSDHSGTIEAVELQHVTFDRAPLGLEVAQKLVQVFDKDRNGRIDFFEYASMHKFISHMRQAFISADRDRSGRIEEREIHEGLRGAGFAYVSIGTIRELLVKFDKTRKGLDWREFLLMAAHIANVRSVFHWNDTQKKGQIILTEDQLTHISAYLI